MTPANDSSWNEDRRVTGSLSTLEVRSLGEEMDV
jgi:hypothetical protein